MTGTGRRAVPRAAAGAWSTPAAASAAEWSAPTGATWYRPRRPPADLTAGLAVGWTARMAGRYRLVPDGAVELLWLDSGTIWLCGPETAAWQTDLPAPVDAVGIRFRPGQVAGALRLDVAELRDRRVPVEDVFGSGFARRLADRLGSAPGPAARLDLLHGAARGWLAEAADPDPVAGIVAGLLTADPATSVADLAAEAGRSGRQLHRRCRSAFGYGPATLRRILRLQRFLALSRRTDAGLATLAVLAGYTDQPHLSRDCRQIAGVSPAVLVGARSAPPSPARRA
ncbi:AraC family transcriptional regulator [Actinocatenispora thailandica]|uniref:AraC family transcriptional regulator n=1 Tax=Actinocatenispora thailandica TaxID=227318 RepID=A0A7R7DU81_9ACTN|nr:helix-turn-helix transcriptional regulator [Actinocatenispora thailandica]BCJ37846.1 AraC family transcriptional regulator [Actinocatenispora thailandica]